MTSEDDNDTSSAVQTAVQTQEGEFQVDTGKVDAGSKSDESTTNVAASFSCEECGEKFTTRQELKEHTQVH